MIRPDSLREFAQAASAGREIDQAAYQATLASEVADIVGRQAAVGVDVISDGEYGKPGWTNYSMERVSGFEYRPSPPGRLGFRGHDAELFKEFYAGPQPGLRPAQAATPPPTPNRGSAANRMAVCVGPVTYTDAGRATMQRDVANLKAALSSVQVEEAFLPVVAPCSIFMNYENEYYKTDEEFLFAVADALHEEYKIITDAGLLVQCDDAILAVLHDFVVDKGLDYRKWVQMNIEALNYGLRGIPQDRVRYHLCWGSWQGPHYNDVPLAQIVDLILKVDAQAISLEAANPRHEWEWVVWQDTKLPDGKILMPGVISHAITHIEHPELVAQRITRYARLLGAENIIASTDCGFAQVANQERQNRQIVWAKLEALAEGAKLAATGNYPALI